jgi:hypothetical protein
MSNYFDTLNEALASEGLVDQWQTGTNINYGETVQVNTGERLISVYRNSNGRYERPVHYSVI